ncbi:MAG: ATP-grasp domain-containing protein, partial [Sphingomonas sp.]
AITLCRCMNIPARYCTGYLGDIGVPADPAPMDFSAWMEIYLSGRWWTLDARHNQPRIGRILIARGLDGNIARYDPPLNVHRDAILRHSAVPAPAAVLVQADEAAALAERIAAELDYVGVLACEFFVGADGPVFNEMAPRVHNSGHWTIEGAECSQFENHIRAICGLPLGATTLTGREATMENLIGDDADRWAELLAESGAHLHLYGKGAARPGRKMGHVTRIRH